MSFNVTDERFSIVSESADGYQLAQTEFAWLSQLKLSEIITPSGLNDVTRSTAVMLKVT